MIQVNLTLHKEEEGVESIIAVEADGHAKTGRPGEDILCAAVSVLIRTCFRSLETIRSVELNLKKPDKTGFLSFSLDQDKVSEKMSAEIAGITRFLMVGLHDLVEEYPDNIKLNRNYID